MNNLTDNDLDLAYKIANTISQGFDKHYQVFRQETSQAKIFFETGDSLSEQKAIKERIAYYDKRIQENIAILEQEFEIDKLNKAVWEKIKLFYLDSLIECLQPELAETFFNSVVCKILHRDYFHNKNIFRRPLISLEYLRGSNPTYDSYYPQNLALRKILQKILLNPTWNVKYINLTSDIAKILLVISNFIGERGCKWPQAEYNCQVQVLHSPFYQNTAAYIIGKLLNGAIEYPFTIVVRRKQTSDNTEYGLYVDAVILDPQQISKMFSLSRAYFMVDIEIPSAYIKFLNSLIPNKPSSELYTMLGLGKQGKTAFYRDLTHHLGHSKDKFIIAPGIAGLVMVVFMLPSFPFVFKIIRDKFGASKNIYHSTVKEKYTLVKQVDRVGRMADTLEYSHVALPINRFSPDLLEQLKKDIPSLLEFDQDTVLIKHLYIERRMVPLNIHISKMEAEGKLTELKHAVVEYGNAIKELADANIFPGDMLWKNFGINRYKRVVFYDYDEIELMTDCKFRKIPECPYPEMEMSSEPWYSVGKNDVFPEEFGRFILGSKTIRKIFMDHHANLLTSEYWQEAQKRVRDGKMNEHFPYNQDLRFQNINRNLNVKNNAQFKASEGVFTEKTISSKDVFNGELLHVKSDSVELSDKTITTREYIVHPGAAAIITFANPNTLIMVKQFRYPIGKTFLEIPAGKLNKSENNQPNELPINTAKRELEEETGYRAKKWIYLGVGHICIGYSNEIIYYYAAFDLSKHQTNLDEGEIVETVEMPVAKVLSAIECGEITDSKTINGIMLAISKGLIRVN